MASIEQQIKVKIDALVSGLTEVQKLQKEIQSLQSNAGKKLSINTSSIESGFSKVTNLIRAFSTEADQSIGKVESLGSAVGVTFAGMGAPVGIAVAAVAALGAAIVGVGAIAVSTSKEFAATGLQIGQIADKTGFSTEAISAYRVGLAGTNIDLDQVGKGLIKFDKYIVQAATSSKSGAAILAVMGINAKQAVSDPQGAFDKFLAFFNKLPDGAIKAQLAVALFGKAGGELIPFFEKFGHGTEAAIEAAEAMGLVFDRDGAQKAKELSEAYGRLSLVMEGVGLTIGHEVAPAMEGALNDISKSLISSKELFKSWGDDIATVVKGVRVTLLAFQSSGGIVQSLELLAGGATGKLSDALQLAAGQVKNEGPPGKAGTGIAATPKDQSAADALKKLLDAESEKQNKGKSAAQIAAETQLHIAQDDLKDAETLAKAATEANKLAFDERLKNADDYAKKATEIENERYFAEVVALNKEQAAIKSLPTGTPEQAAESERATRDLQSKRLSALVSHNNAIIEINKQSADAQKQLAKETDDAIENIFAEGDKKQIAEVKAMEDANLTTHVKAAAAIDAVELGAINRRIEALRADSAEMKQNEQDNSTVELQISALLVQRSALLFKTLGDWALARKKDTDDAKENAAKQLAIQKKQFDDAKVQLEDVLNEEQEKRDAIQDQISKGDLSEYAGKLKIIALQKQYNDIIQQLIVLLKQKAAAVNDPQEAAKLNLEVDKLQKGIDKSKESFGDLGNQIKATAEDKGIDDLTENLADFLNGTKTAKQAFSDFAISIISDIDKMIIKFLILKLVSKFLFPDSGDDGSGVFSDGTSDDGDGFAAGGHVLGPGTGTSDSIPAMLSNNEFVQPNAAVQHYGVEFMEAIRRLRFPRAVGRMLSLGTRLSASVASGFPARLADGGLVSRVAGPGGTGPTVNQYFNHEYHTPNPLAGPARKTIERDVSRAAARGLRSSNGRVT